MDYSRLKDKLQQTICLSDVKFLSILDLAKISKNDTLANQVYGFYTDYLAKPHKDIGRIGAVCPFIPLALKLNTIHTVLVQNSSFSEKDTKKLLLGLLHTLQSLDEAKEESSFVIFFATPSVTKEVVLKIQKEMKPDFVKEGYMIGEFFQGNQSPGLHNKHFHPLQSPVPALAIRTMIQADLPFMLKNEYSNREKKYFLSNYHKRFPAKHQWITNINIGIGLTVLFLWLLLISIR